MDFSAELLEGIRALRKQGSDLRLCDAEESASIVATAKRRFVNNSPRAWWMDLKYPAVSVYYPDGNAICHLASHTPNGDEPAWLIFETGEAAKPVIAITTVVAQQLLAELPYIEYYLIARDYSWMLIESDHNVLYIVRGEEN